MSNHDSRDDHDQLTELRRRAEEAAERRVPGETGREESLDASDPEALLLELQRQQHELHVHQIELRLQMDQLVQTNIALERTRNEYHDLFDFAPVGYLTLDRSGAILRANLTASRLFGVARPDLVRKRLSALVDAQDVSAFALFLRRVFEAPVKRTVELRLTGSDGKVFHAQLECIAVEDEHRQLTECRATLIDITRQREAQEEVLRLNSTLEERVEQRSAHIRELNEELEAFVYSVTHDLLTPLRHIRSFTGKLTASLSELDEQQQRNAEHVMNSVDRMEHLLGGLLTFFRTGRQRVRFVQVDLNRVLAEVRKDLAGEFARRGVDFTSDELPTVTGDTGTLQVVFASLLDNALKFTRGREQPRVRVVVRDSGNEYLIGVEDNGVGFNMRQKNRLFGMFQRLHAERDFEGAGVSLALVRRLVLRHGGRVWAEGKVGQGATFWFSLPKESPAVHEGAASRRARQSP